MGAKNPFLRSSASRHGKREKGQDPLDLDFGSGGLDTIKIKLLATVSRELREDFSRRKGMHRLVGGSRGGSKEGWAIGPKKEEGGSLEAPCSPGPGTGLDRADSEYAQ